MFKTIAGFIKIIYNLIKTRTKLKVAKQLDTDGKIVERDELVSAGVSDWARYMVKISGSTVEIVGEDLIPQDTAVVFVGNHQGYFDIPILLGYIKKTKAFIAKIEILKVPILSQWMKLMQCTFLDRKDMRQSVRAMREAVETVKKGYSLVIFPEGTRSKGGPVAEFKAGSFKLAIKAGVPIVPITIDGSWRIFEHTGKFAKSHVKVTIHPAIPIADLSREELTELPNIVREKIVSALPLVSNKGM